MFCEEVLFSLSFRGRANQTKVMVSRGISLLWNEHVDDFLFLISQMVRFGFTSCSDRGNVFGCSFLNITELRGVVPQYGCLFIGPILGLLGVHCSCAAYEITKLVFPNIGVLEHLLLPIHVVL